MEAISVTDLEVLMKSFSITSKAQFARECGVTANAAQPWFHGEMPRRRLVAVAQKLELRIQRDGGVPNEDQKRAKEVLVKVLKKTFPEIIAEPSPLALDKNAMRLSQDRKAVGLYFPTKETPELLMAALQYVDAELLVDALQAKGWIVTVTRKVPSSFTKTEEIKK